MRRIPFILTGIIYKLILYLFASTWRIRLIGDCRVRKLLGSRFNSCIYTFWHRWIFPLSFTHRSRGITVLVSLHRDGEYIATAIRRLGFNVVRGSSSFGKLGGLKGLIRGARAGFPLVITPDGPRGPACEAKRGFAQLAHHLKIPIILVGLGVSRKIRLKSWDGFTIPLPFARIVAIFAGPIYITQQPDDALVHKLGKLLNHLDTRADELAKQQLNARKHRF